MTYMHPTAGRYEWKNPWTFIALWVLFIAIPANLSQVVIQPYNTLAWMGAPIVAIYVALRVYRLARRHRD